MRLGTKVLIALAAAVGEMLVAAWVTSGTYPSQGSKVLHAAVLVLPFLLVAKSETAGFAATAIPFLIYFAASLLLVFWIFRERSPDSPDAGKSTQKFTKP